MKALNILFITNLLFTTSQTVSADPVGVLVPLTGEMQVFGKKAMEGIQLVEDEFPQTSFVIEDVGTGASVSVASATSKLLSQDKVSAIIGEFFLDQTLVAAPISEKAGVPLFSQTLCSPDLKKFKIVACGYPSTEEQLASIKDLLKTINTKKAAFFIENSSYGEDTLRVAEPNFKAAGVEIVANERINGTERDFRTLITRILKKNPDTIFAVTTDPGQSFAFFQQLHQLGYKGARIGYLDIDPKYIQEFGQAIEGVYLPGFISPVYSKDFNEKFQKKFGHEPDMYAALAYDLIRTVILGSKEESEGTLFQRVLKYKLKDPAIEGYAYRPDGTISVPVTVLQIRDGKFLPR